MLRKLVFNDWVHVSSGIVLEDRGRMVNWHVPVLRDFFGGGRFKCRKMASKEEFLYK